MPSRVALFSLLVPDYDEALAFFGRIGFECREDTDLGGGKRWVRIAPKGAETDILLARAANPRQVAAIGEIGRAVFLRHPHRQDRPAEAEVERVSATVDAAIKEIFETFTDAVDAFRGLDEIQDGHLPLREVA